MKQITPSLRPRAALVIGAAFLSTPAFAQDAQVAPPPIAVTPAPAPAPAAAQTRFQVAPSTPIVQQVPTAPAAAPEAAAPETRRATRAAPAQAARPAPRRAPTAAVQAAAAAAPPQAAAPVGAPDAPAAAPAPASQPAPVQEAAPAATTAPAAEAPATATQTNTSRVSWPWLLGGLLVVVGAIAAVLLSRRRREEPLVAADDYYAEPRVAPEPHVAPESRVAAEPLDAPVIAPVAPEFAAVSTPDVRQSEAAAFAQVQEEPATGHVEEAVVHSTDSGDLEGIVDAPAPVSSRPWLEFGMRPVRAGTTEEDALVEFELTVGNSGDTPARDVHLSTFMLADGEPSDMERLLMEHRGEDAVAPMTIEAGAGTRVDATLAAPKEGLGRVFNPIVIAEARYTLPGGREGRTAAAFRIGRPAAEGGIGPIGSTRPHMVENVEAEVYGTPEHA